MATKPKKLKIENFPILIKDSEQFVPRAKYIASRAEQLSKKADKGGLGVKLEVAHVKELLKFAETGADLDPESPNEMVTAFDLIKKDYARAIENAEELEVKAEEDKKKQELALVEKQSYEAELYKSVEDAESLANFDQFFDTTNRNRCVAREGVEVSDKQLVGALAMAFSLSDLSDWSQGDVVLELEKRGHKGVVSSIADRFKIPYSTLSNKARVCAAIPVDQRDKLTIPFGTIATITLAKLADKPEENVKIQKKLLTKAQGEKWTQTDAREKVRAVQGKQPSAGAGDKNPRYLELNLATLTKSKFLKDKPDFSEETFVIDVKNHQFLEVQEKDGKSEEVWLDFDNGELPPIESAADDQNSEENGGADASE